MRQLFRGDADKANADAFGKLQQTLRGGRLLAFVGAGVSRRVGYPVWNTLLEQLHDQAVRKEFLPEHTEYLRENSDLLWRAQFYRQIMGSSRFDRLVGATFRKQFRVDTFLRTLVRLPFRHFLTTNYDDVLTASHRRVYRRQPRVLDWSQEKQLREFINELSEVGPARRAYVHLHGRITPAGELRNIVLTDADYAERYLKSEDTRRKLFTLFATQRVVFIGFSMNDPDLQSLIRLVHASLGSDRPRHFAILALSERDGHPELVRRQWNEKYGIEPIFYPYVKDHKALESVIGRLSRKSERLPSLHVPATRRAQTSPLPTAPVDPEDPQRGQWGGRADSRSRRLSANIIESYDDYYEVRVLLESLDGSELREPVRFHLHDTFDPAVWSPDGWQNERRQAYLDIETYGAFTVGVEADGGATRLEYDLARIKGAPKDFREG